MNSLLHAAVVRMGVDQQCVRGCNAFAHMAVDSVQLLHTYEWSLQVHETCDQPGTVWNVDQWRPCPGSEACSCGTFEPQQGRSIRAAPDSKFHGCALQLG